MQNSETPLHPRGRELCRGEGALPRQALVSDHCGIGIPVFISILDGHSTKLKGLEPVPTGGLMGYNYSEYVWLDS